MPLLRRWLTEFVQDHNHHPIRRQPRREYYMPTGIPSYLWEYSVPPPRWIEIDDQHPALNELAALVEDYDIHSYLPLSMIALCDQIMQQHNISKPEYFVRTSEHKESYKSLRKELWALVRSGQVITELPSHVGSAAELERHLKEKELAEVHQEAVIEAGLVLDDGEEVPEADLPEDEETNVHYEELDQFHVGQDDQLLNLPL
jgi:hypothetical protein